MYEYKAERAICFAQYEGVMQIILPKVKRKDITIFFKKKIL
jgi:hypothetical protein